MALSLPGAEVIASFSHAHHAWTMILALGWVPPWLALMIWHDRSIRKSGQETTCGADMHWY